jgi:hypothetical protein
MADIQTLIQATGPLPIDVTFQNDTDEPFLLYVAGSAWANQPGMIGVQVAIDGNVLDTVSVYANEGNSHKTLVAKIIQVPALKIGPHEIKLIPLPGTNIDANDSFSVSAILGQAWIINHQGAIPSYTAFQSEADTPALFFLSGSAFRNPAGPIGLGLVIDGNMIATSNGWVNEVNSHHALPPVMIVADLTVGQHEIGISMTSGETNSDLNDLFCAAVIY